MWSEWEEVSDKLLIQLYRKAKELGENELIKIVLAEIRSRFLICNNCEYEQKTKPTT